MTESAQQDNMEWDRHFRQKWNEHVWDSRLPFSFVNDLGSVPLDDWPDALLRTRDAGRKQKLSQSLLSISTGIWLKWRSVELQHLSRA